MTTPSLAIADHDRTLGDANELPPRMPPQLYTLNVFRLTGLHVDAPSAELAREVARLQQAVDAGVGVQTRDMFALGMPSAEQIKTTMQSFTIAEQQMLQKFFWFWPIAGDSQTDDALMALHRGEPALAESVWTANGLVNGVVQRELDSVQVLLDAHCTEAEQAMLVTKKRGLEHGLDRARTISIHNLAVLHHVYALRLETAPNAVHAERQAERLSEWKKAFAWWSLLRDRPVLEPLMERDQVPIQDSEDTSLTDAARAICNTLPLLLLSINAALAASAVREKNFAAAVEQRQIMKASGFGQDCVNRALRGGLIPVEEELALLRKNAEASSQANPSSGFPTVRQLFLDADKCLRGLRCLLDTGDSMRVGAHDLIAQSARTCLWACANATQDWRVAQPLFQECFTVAEGNSLRFSIRRDLETVADKIAAHRDGAQPVFTLAARADADRNRRELIAGADRKRRGMIAGVIALAVVTLISVFVIQNRRAATSLPVNAQTQMPAPQRPAIAPPVSEAPPALDAAMQTAPILAPPARLDAATQAASVPASTELSGLRRSISHSKMQLNGMEPTLLSLQQRLATLHYTMAADKAFLDSKAGDAGVGSKTYEATRERRDSSLAIYNGTVDEYIAMVHRYKSLAESTNAQVANYNNRVQSRSDQLPGYRIKW